MQPGALPTGLGIVVGLEAEARLARRLVASGLVGISAATASGAASAAAQLLARGATHLLSFGLAAGLDPALRPGDLLVPAVVVAGGTRYLADPAFRALLGPGRDTSLLQSDVLVTGVAEKADLLDRTGCQALDMESGAVAQAAARRGVPFAVLRAICDPAGRNLPPAACIALRPDGRVNGPAVAASILWQPRQLPALIALGRDATRAKDQLSRWINDRLAM